MSYDPKAVVDEVQSGLKNEKSRLEEALYNREFYEGHFERWPVRAPEGYEPYRYQRRSRFLRWVVQALTRNLYREGPTRALPDHPEATDWLAKVYRQWWANSAWQDADRAATWGGVCAWQVRGTADPDRPLGYYLWGADELCVWLDDDDPTLPVAVATLDNRDHRRRLRLWDADTLRTFETAKFSHETADRTLFRPVSTEPNPYGVVPFAFVHFEPPTSRFTTSGPGQHLREVNDWLNFTLTETGDTLRYDIRPVTLAYNVRPGWRPPPIRPGSVWDVPAEAVDAGGSGPEPRLEHHQADPGFVSVTWEDIDNFLGHTLETHGIPRAAFRLEQAAARSGVSIVAEQLPLLDWAQSRQRPFGRYEESLAVLTLRIGAAHLRNNGVARADLGAAAADPGLVLHWGRMWPNLPGPDRDQSDQWRLDAGLTSRTEVLMEREGLSREEAEAKLELVARDRKREQSLLGPAPPPEKPQAAAGDDKAVDSDEPMPEGDSSDG